jgi:chitinase
MSKIKFLIPVIFLFAMAETSFCQKKPLNVIAYYAGPAGALDSFPIEKLSVIIFSFAHLKGSQFHISNAKDSATLQKMVSLKSRNPNLKVMISIGGWGGCAPCSDTFSTKANRKAFALSVKKVNQYFGTDGIDLDWEYPVIEGFPSHHYKLEDKRNFTQLVKRLRKTLGSKSLISFASGGFTSYIDSSIDWKRVMKKVDFVNVMSYDLVNGYASKTGNHTALYSTPGQIESADHAISKMIDLGVPANKIAIGAAFYAKVWQNVPDTSFGLYQPGTYKRGVSYKNFGTQLSADSGFVYHWDSVAHAPFMYNPQQKLFATFDDKKSVDLKTKYAIEKGLYGMMFWQLRDDQFSDGLVDEIDKMNKNKIFE